MYNRQKSAKLGGIIAALFCLLAILLPADAIGAKATMVITKANPSQSPVTLVFTQPLPPRINPDTDLLEDLDDGMELKYDEDTDSHYIEIEHDFEPGEVVTFRVVLRDVWIIPEEDIDEVRQHAAMLSDELSGTKRKDSAARFAIAAASK